MQYVAIIAAVIALFKDTFSGLFKSREIKVVAVLGLAYYLYNKAKKQEDKDGILNNLPDNQAAMFAQQLHTAFHPLISESFFGLYLPDGTDEAAVERIASQAGKLKNYKAVSEAYTALHARSLDEDLRSEGVFDLFFNTYNSASVSSTPSTNNLIAQPNSTANKPALKKGDKVYTAGGWNLRSTNSPYAVIDKTVVAQDWILYNNPYYSNIGGTAGWWVVVEQPKSRYLLYPSYYVVSVDAFLKK